MLSFSRDPKGYVQDLLRSQSRDLKVRRETQGGLQWKISTSADSDNSPQGGTADPTLPLPR